MVYNKKVFVTLPGAFPDGFEGDATASFFRNFAFKTTAYIANLGFFCNLTSFFFSLSAISISIFSSL
jgi:hypothetical protein